jgi:hypothetical protein
VPRYSPGRSLCLLLGAVAFFCREPAAASKILQRVLSPFCCFPL